MSCVGLLALAGAAPQCSSSSTENGHEDEQSMVQYGNPSKLFGGPLMMEVSLKVDKCLARLQSLQGTVTIPTPAMSATVSACMSPVYTRSKSCMGSPRFEKEEKENVIRIHDILRFSDDFTGKFSSLTQEHRGKYMRRLSRSKTEVFDDKKDPRDPHGEWKHWSSPAGDVHKVISEILMASQIAKEITSMVNACLVQDICSSDEERRGRRQSKNSKHRYQAQSSFSTKDAFAAAASSRALKKEDPMHRYRVVTPADSSKRRGNSGNRKEVLYPKSKLPSDTIRLADDMQEISSTERKMQSRRSPRASVSSPRTSVEEPVLKVRSKAGAVPCESSRAGAESRASAEDFSLRNHALVAGESPLAATTDCAQVETSVLKNHARDAGAAESLISGEPVPRNHARVAVFPELSLQEQAFRKHGRVVAESSRLTTTPRSSVDEPVSRYQARTCNTAKYSRASEPPVLTKIRTKVAAPESSSAHATPRTSVEHQILTRIRTRVAAAVPISGSGTPRPPVEEPTSKPRTRVAATPTKSATTSDMWEAKEITNFSSPRAMGESKNSAKPCSNVVKKVRQSRSPPQASHTCVEPRLSTSSSGAVQSSSIRGSRGSHHQSVNFAASAKAVQQPQFAPTRIGRFSEENVPENSFGAVTRTRRTQSDAVLQHRPVSIISSNAAEQPVVTASRFDDSTFELPIPQPPSRVGTASTTSNGSLKGGRNDDWFRKSLEATEIKLGPTKLWKSGNKAVLFSNPTFAPASPPGARPAPERPGTPPVRQPSPSRSTSATRRVKEWVGNVLHGRRSVSPDIAGRLGSSNRKLISLSPGRSLPSLISRLPSRGRKASNSAPRATVFPSSAPKVVGQLPLPPCRQGQQQQLAKSKLTELPVPPGRQILGLKAQKEMLDLQAHSMAAQKKVMVEDWSKTVEPPAPFAKDVGVVEHGSGPALYSMGKFKEVDYSANAYLKATASRSPQIDMREISYTAYCREVETNLPTRKEREIANFKRGSGWENEVGVTGVLSQCRTRSKEPFIVSASVEFEKENVPVAAVECVAQGAALRRSWSTGSQRSTSTIRAMSTGKVRTGPSLLKRAKDWMRTQTPFRDRPQRTRDLS